MLRAIYIVGGSIFIAGFYVAFGFVFLSISHGIFGSFLSIFFFLFVAFLGVGQIVNFVAFETQGRRPVPWIPMPSSDWPAHFKLPLVLAQICLVGFVICQAMKESARTKASTEKQDAISNGDRSRSQGQ